jgi:Integrase core domain
MDKDTTHVAVLRQNSVYGHAFRHRVTGMGIRDVLTAPQSPWQNPFAERLIGSIRRECLDHVLVYLSLDKDAPTDGRLSRRNSARSSRCPKSAACIIATPGARPESAPPVRDTRNPPPVGRSPSHSPHSSLSLVGPTDPQTANRPASHRPCPDSPGIPLASRESIDRRQRGG